MSIPKPAVISRLKRPTGRPSLMSLRAHAMASSSDPRSSEASSSPLTPYTRKVDFRPKEACIGMTASLPSFLTQRKGHTRRCRSALPALSRWTESRAPESVCQRDLGEDCRLVAAVQSCQVVPLRGFSRARRVSLTSMGPGSDLDRSLYTLRGQAGVEIPAFAVQRLRAVLVCAHLQLDAVEAETMCLLLDCQSQTGSDSPATMRGKTTTSCRCEGRRGVAYRITRLPFHQVLAALSVKSRQAKHGATRSTPPAPIV